MLFFLQRSASRMKSGRQRGILARLPRFGDELQQRSPELIGQILLGEFLRAMVGRSSSIATPLGKLSL